MKHGYSKRSARLARKLGWNRIHSNGLRSRIWSLTTCADPWWQWGHRVMILTCSDFGGNWDEPTPETWWYRRSETKRMWRTGYPRLKSFEIIKGDHAELNRRLDGLNEDQRYEWQAICVNGDNELILGHRYWGGSFYGMRSDEVRLLRRYLRMWHRHNWFGLRSWLYSQGLHQAVTGHRPFSCAITPPKGTGGYSHWHCQLDRKHDGPHQFNNYTWDEADEHVKYQGVTS